MKTGYYHKFVFHVIVGGLIYVISVNTKVIDNGLEAKDSNKHQISSLCFSSVFIYDVNLLKVKCVCTSWSPFLL